MQQVQELNFEDLDNEPFLNYKALYSHVKKNLCPGKMNYLFFDEIQKCPEIVTKIKLFVEGLMPFFILKDFTGKISDQLDFEEKGEIFYYIQQYLFYHYLIFLSPLKQYSYPNLQ